jgi:hypothetical protein
VRAAVRVARRLFEWLREAEVDVFFMESLLRRWVGGWVLDRAVGLLATVENDATCAVEALRVCFSLPSCRSYVHVGFANVDSPGVVHYLTPISVTSCPLVQVKCGGRERVLAPTYAYDGFTLSPGLLLVEVEAEAPRWRRHLWPPAAAAGWRPLDFCGGARRCGPARPPQWFKTFRSIQCFTPAL